MSQENWLFIYLVQQKKTDAMVFNRNLNLTRFNPSLNREKTEAKVELERKTGHQAKMCWEEPVENTWVQKILWGHGDWRKEKANWWKWNWMERQKKWRQAGAYEYRRSPEKYLSIIIKILRNNKNEAEINNNGEIKSTLFRNLNEYLSNLDAAEQQKRYHLADWLVHHMGGKIYYAKKKLIYAVWFRTHKSSTCTEAKMPRIWPRLRAQ